jgi:hypothetical protein
LVASLSKDHIFASAPVFLKIKILGNVDTGRSEKGSLIFASHLANIFAAPGKSPRSSAKRYVPVRTQISSFHEWTTSIAE